MASTELAPIQESDEENIDDDILNQVAEGTKFNFQFQGDYVEATGEEENTGGKVQRLFWKT